MALSFSVSSLTLENWGISAGDIAVLAGAGRMAGTWVMSQFKDRALLDWMNMDVDTVFTRKALLNVTELHDRWDQKITLLKNGKRSSYPKDGGKGVHVLQQMDRFTWLMTLLSAALDAAMKRSDQRQLLTRFLLKLFEDNEAGAEFLRHEAEYHIQGWMSAACVRNIALKARDVWQTLEKKGKHQPGFIPESELNGLFHFLHWLVCGEEKQYQTASTDIFSVATILKELGINIKTTENQNDYFDESQIVVAWSDKVIPSVLTKALTVFRPGMRIPLQHIEEVASLFPISHDPNQLRGIFQSGMDAVKEDGLSLRARRSDNDPPRVRGSPFLKEDQDLMYWAELASRKTIPRLKGDAYRLADTLFAILSSATCHRFAEIVDNLNKDYDDSNRVNMLALMLNNEAQQNRSYGLNENYDYGDALYHIQAFVLGYWYQLLLPLLDTSQLASQEAFGSWKWADVQALNLIREIVAMRLHLQKESGKIYFYYRHEMLKLTAYLFGGAEISQLQSARFGAVGVLGKIPLLYSCLARGTWDNFGKFSLLDVDASCIPSSTCGIVIPGQPKSATKSTPEILRIAPYSTAFDQVHILGLQKETIKDFTIHIEPDWDYDSQTCLVVYRHKGRMVHKVNPRQIDLVLSDLILGKEQATDPSVDDTASQPSMSDDPPYQVLGKCNILPLHSFEGGQFLEPEEKLAEARELMPVYRFHPILINTVGAVNALVCLACMYQGWAEETSMVAVKTQSQFEKAIKDCAKVIVVTDVGKSAD
ncbi:hypothetical protein K469DRAFT_690893 [Zopfia rhizophila CBS 207.26]|uniref:Uncharacterized protein n=1 Tax=Zopfia rhizophila CBS 207.26 TaxID=1314779 RepID=A0A6A6DXL9_9PEZI|nr:hypothetical protein K469DRAFT_690893 [Zopfia rhizophila CBS 207.26]